MLPGFATPEFTAAFAARHIQEQGVATGHYRTVRGLTVGSVGLGTYLGDADAETDDSYESAVVEFVKLGGNLIDTAINYRAQRSERSIGRALKRLEHEAVARREELVLCTKGGYFSFDGRYPKTRKDVQDWVEKTFFETGILQRDDVAQACHAMSPAYLRHQIAASLGNLGVDTIDVYYLHNPETQLANLDRAGFLKRVRAAFETLEEYAAAGAIRWYGCATWNGFRAAPTSDEYLSLEELVAAARDIAGDGHRFRFVQLPFNLAMLEAARFANQRVGDRLMPLFEAAHRLDITCIASASILQGKLAQELPEAIAEAFPGLPSDALRSIQFNRSAPNLDCTLVGMGRAPHVVENMGLAKRPPAPPETVKRLLLKLA
ncbi:MAG: aldo/keto reductase [Planctomycetes bacterium]|nr:aldo/keto reductase [Planctomycetota bacterium]